MNKSKLNQKSNDKLYRNIFDATIEGLIIIDLVTDQVIEANPAAYTMHGYTLNNFIGLPLATLIHKDSLKTFNTAILNFRTNGELVTQVQHNCQDGTTIIVEWRGREFAYQGRSYLLSNIRDVSDNNQAEQLVSEKVEIRTHEQKTLLAISHTLASTMELQPNLILEQLGKIIEYSNGGLFRVENSSLVILAIRGARLTKQTLPIKIHLHGPEILAKLFSNNLPVIIADLGAETPEAKALHSLLKDEAVVLHKEMQSWMWVPFGLKNRIFGCIGIASEKKNHFTFHDATLSLSVGNQVAITMANQELYEKAQALAALEERQRLAHNLHDAVNQSLFSAGIIAEVLPNIWKSDPELAQKSLLDLRKLTRSAQAEMRALLAELRPSILIDSDLNELLHLLGNALSGRIDIPVIINVPEEVVLPIEVQIAFYRICQEALHNIAKHAKASLVEINLTHDKIRTELCIHDNGQGFDIEQTNPNHYGLKIIGERAEGIGAQLSISSQPGHGTELVIQWTNSTPKEKL